MGTLEERLARIREGALKRIPEDKRALMHRATQELETSGAVDRALVEGDDAPSFTLPNTEGVAVGLRGLLDRGPVVMTFFRGQW